MSGPRRPGDYPAAVVTTSIVEPLPGSAPPPDPETVPPVVAVMVTHQPGPTWEDSLQSLAQQTYANLVVFVVETAGTTPPTPAVATVATDPAALAALVIAASDVDDAVPAGTRGAGAPQGADGRAGEIPGDDMRDPGSVAARLRAVLPEAHLLALETDPGYGPASNEAIGAVEGAAFLLLCHDDVVFDPQAVQVMVEEAFRSNAGIVGPKVVTWDDPGRLAQVGMGADKFGAPAPLVERGELDQEQHDAVRDVFYIPGGAMLVRADLFASLGGFDPGIDFIGEDLDLCWRAHIAGARVLVAPAATIAHREAWDERRSPVERRRLAFRHRLRAQLVCYGRWHRWRVLPQSFVLAVIEAFASLALGRVEHARAVTAAWTANLGDLGSIRERRRIVKRTRRVKDKEIRTLQAGGSARVAAFFRGQLGSNDDRLASMAGTGRDLAATLRSSTTRASIAAWVFVLAVFAFGSRDLLTAPIPAVGEFVAFPSGADALLREWVSGYHAAGLGSGAANPTAFGLLGGLGVAFFGAMGQLRRVLILGMLPLGALGMWRLAKPIGSRRSRIVALVVYAVIPVAVNSIGIGRWSGLVSYALAPWIINQLARASRLAPFGAVGDEAGPGIVERPVRQRVLILGVVTAIGAAFVPYLLVLVPGIAVAMAAGGLLVGQVRGVLRMLGVAIAAVALALVLHLPWTLDFVTPAWAQLAGTASVGRPDLPLDEILRFSTGTVVASPLSWAVLVTAALAVLVGRRWRLAWAVRGWAVAVASWGIVWFAAQGRFVGYLPAPEVLLAPAAAGLALASALGMASFEVDLPDYHFGWRQIASLLAGAALVVALVPMLQRSVDGSWTLPHGDFDQLLTNLDSPSDSFRIAWIGEPVVMPLEGWPLDAPAIEQPGADGQPGRLVYATTTGRTPTVQNLWPGSDDGATSALRAALQDAAAGQTDRLGALLAPMGIEYLVVPQRLAPAPYSSEVRSSPTALLDMLADQLDLARVELPAGLTVYRNTAWGPATARLPRDAAIPPGGASALTDRVIPSLAGAPDAVPNDTGFASAAGAIPGPATVYVASASSDRWQLKVNGTPQVRGPALGWANQYTVDASGQITLQYQTSKVRYLWLAAQVLLWLVVLGYLWRTRVAKEDARDRAHVREVHDL